MAGLTLLAVPSLASCRHDSTLSSNASPQPSGSSAPGSSRTASAAPSAPATSTPVPAASPSPPSASGGGTGSRAVRACRAADLHVAVGTVGAGAGQRYTMLKFHTLHGRTCVLRNDLTQVVFLRGDGARLPTHVRRTGDQGTSITLHPDETAYLNVHFTVVGPKRFTPQTLKFTVPGGGQDTVAWPHGATVGDDGQIELGRLHR